MMHDDDRHALEHAADLAAVIAELVDHLGVEVDHAHCVYLSSVRELGGLSADMILACSRTRLRPMPKQQRAIRMEQKSQLAAMQTLESRSDEELQAETRFRAAAQAILGARAAERYDAKAAREHFQKALAAARPQERMQLRRMADASLALAERRAGDLKAATEKLGVESPSSRQLFILRLFGLIAP